MKSSTVSASCAMILVSGHIIAMFLVLVLLKDFFATVAERLEIILILSPLTGLFALAALKYILKEKDGDKNSPRVGVAYTFVCIIIPLVFVGFIIYAILSYPFGVADSPQNLRITISAVEVALGGLLGLISEHVFGVRIKDIREHLPRTGRRG